MTEWFKEALKLADQGLDRKEICNRLGKSRNTVNSAFYRYFKKRQEEAVAEPAKKIKATVAKVEVQEELIPTTDTEIKDIIVNKLKRPKRMDEIVKIMPKDVDAQRIAQVMDSMKENGQIIDDIGGKLCLRTIIMMDQKNVVDTGWNGEKLIRFGIVSDPHMTSKYQQLTHLNAMYDLFQREGIHDVYNPGDILEGEYQSRKGHAYEIFRHGADDQVEYAIENYPKRDGMTTHFITGNHDHTHLKNGGYDIGKPIARERADMNYLGMNNATIMLTPNCRMDMTHPLDGSSYALSYSMQKAIEALPVDDLPDIFVTGHHHKAIYAYIRGIHSLEAGTFQAQSGWMKGKRLAAHVGGWIVSVHVDEEGNVTRFLPEWVPFPKSIPNDY